MTEPPVPDRATKQLLVKYYSEHPRELLEPTNMSRLFRDDVDEMDKALRFDWFIHYPVADKHGPRVASVDAQQAFLIPNEIYQALWVRQQGLTRMLSRLEDNALAIGVFAFVLAVAGAFYLMLGHGGALAVLFWFFVLLLVPQFLFSIGVAVTGDICRSRFEALVLRECRKHGEAMPFPRVYALLLAARIEQRRQEEESKSRAAKLKARLKNRREFKVFAAGQLASFAVQVPLILLGVTGANLAGKAAEKAVELGLKRDETEA